MIGKSMKDFIIGVLYLPFEGYFKPQSFLNRVTTNAPGSATLPDLLDDGWEVNKGVVRSIQQLLMAAVLFPCVFALMTWAFFPSPNLPIILFKSVVAGLAVTFGFGIVRGLFARYDFVMVITVGFIFLASANSIVIAIRYSSTGLMTNGRIGPAVDSEFTTSVNNLVLGIAAGMAVRVGMGAYGKQSLLAGLIILIPLTIVFFVPGSARENSTRFLGVYMLAGFTAWPLLPLQFAVSVINRLLLANNPARASILWRFSPVRWDDFLIVPMPDTLPLLAALKHTNPPLYEKALKYMGNHIFQARFAKPV
jgi:hypothetical protein